MVGFDLWKLGIYSRTFLHLSKDFRPSLSLGDLHHQEEGALGSPLAKHFGLSFSNNLRKTVKIFL